MARPFVSYVKNMSFVKSIPFNLTDGRLFAMTTALGVGCSIWLWSTLHRKNHACPVSYTSSTSTHKHHYNTSNDTSATMVLSDGRTLGYAQYGSTTGRPVFFLHGLATTRIEAAVWDETARELNVRLIAPDRPGTGWSSPQPNRTLLDHPKDIEQLAAHLKVEEYGVMGTSGGGAYALSCAYALPPSSLLAVSILSGLGPPSIGYSGMNWWNWIGFTFGLRLFPHLCGWHFSRQPSVRPGLSDAERLAMAEASFLNFDAHPKDRDVVQKDPDLLRLWLRGCGEAFAQGIWVGSEAVGVDGRLNCTAFGFEVEDIREGLPVRLWYGSLDTNVPPNHGVQIARRLAEREGVRLRVEEETHISLQAVWRREMLEDLVEWMGKRG